MGNAVCELQMEGWFPIPVSKKGLQRLFKNCARLESNQRSWNCMREHERSTETGSDCASTTATPSYCVLVKSLY